jgi:hypothetical protein
MFDTLLEIFKPFTKTHIMGQHITKQKAPTRKQKLRNYTYIYLVIETGTEAVRAEESTPT